LATTLKEDIGKYLLDINKLVFGSIILGGILRSEIPHGIMLIGGVAIFLVTLTFGHWLGARAIKTDKKAIKPPKRRKR